VGGNATTVAVGIVPPEIQRLLAATESRSTRRLPRCAGVRLGDVCAEIEEHVTQRGYTVVRRLSATAWPKLHEDPQV
jgi:hypothetical protein